LSRSKSEPDKEDELIREAVRLRDVSPAETLTIMSDLTEFAVKTNKATRNNAEEKDH
jgi:hypothetical protein